MKLVVNSSPLILLAASRRLELLKELAGEVIVPRAVFRELEAGRRRDQAAQAVAKAGWIRIHPDLLLPQIVASWDLGPGESQVLAIADSEQAIAVLDDLAARNCAKAMTLPLVGTLGVLIAAKEEGLLPAIRPAIQELRQAGLYLSEKVVALALTAAGE